MAANQVLDRRSVKLSYASDDEPHFQCCPTQHHKEMQRPWKRCYILEIIDTNHIIVIIIKTFHGSCIRFSLRSGDLATKKRNTTVHYIGS